MSEISHTPTPWRVETGTTLIWGDCTLYDDGTPDRLGVPVADAQLARAWGSGEPSYERAEANAAYIVKAVNDYAASLSREAALVEALEIAVSALRYVTCGAPPEKPEDVGQSSNYDDHRSYGLELAEWSAAQRPLKALVEIGKINPDFIVKPTAE